MPGHGELGRRRGIVYKVGQQVDSAINRALPLDAVDGRGRCGLLALRPGVHHAPHVSWFLRELAFVFLEPLVEVVSEVILSLRLRGLAAVKPVPPLGLLIWKGRVGDRSRHVFGVLRPPRGRTYSAGKEPGRLWMSIEQP